MLGVHDNEKEAVRQAYLALPYNDPRRRAFRGLEAYYGDLYRAENAAKEAAGGLFQAALAGAGAFIGTVGGYVLFGPAGAIGGALLVGAAGAVVGGAVTVQMRKLLPREVAFLR